MKISTWPASILIGDTSAFRGNVTHWHYALCEGPFRKQHCGLVVVLTVEITVSIVHVVFTLGTTRGFALWFH